MNPGIRMKLAAAFAVAGLALGATPALAAAPADAPYVGVWDCQVGTFVFTRETYSNAGGADMQAATSVEREGNNYIMTFADGYQIGLSSPTDTTMQWLSMESGDMFDCRRLNF
jgi:hypothetical protein